MKITVWTRPQHVATGWDVSEWPTPVPAPTLVNDSKPSIDRIVG